MLALTSVNAVRTKRLRWRGSIFGIDVLRTTSLIRRGDSPLKFHRIAARRRERQKQALLIAPLLISLFILTVGQGREAISKVSKEKILAALQDPLSLFTDRSPGERRVGALFSTKTGPHERVLSTVRDRPAPPILESLPPPIDQFTGPPTSGPPFSNTPFMYPGPPPGPPPPGGPPPGGPPPGGPPPGGPPPGGPPPGGPPPGGPPPGGPPPGGPPTGGPPPDTIPIPEPATWLMVMFGLVAAGAAMRARRRI